MVEEIAALARETAFETGKPVLDARVIAVLGKVPRHRFVPAEAQHAAYRNRPLPIGYGQTISQPYIVALMTDLLNVRPERAVLEIGTGSGYQAAILAELARTVCTIEIIEPKFTVTGMQAAVLDLIRCMEQGGQTQSPPEVARHTVAVTDAILLSQARGNVPVKLAELDPA